MRSHTDSLPSTQHPVSGEGPLTHPSWVQIVSYYEQFKSLSGSESVPGMVLTRWSFLAAVSRAGHRTR
jgi:hypothetical protein